MKKIALLGEFDPASETQAATVSAIEHSAAALGIVAAAEWISTADITEQLLSRYQAAWIAPGSNYRDQERLFQAIRLCREKEIPCLGTCGGFQHMILEYARHELGFPDAQSEEYALPGQPTFISRLACSLRGREMTLTFAPESLAARVYESSTATERYYCNLGVNPAYRDMLHSGRMRITGRDDEGEIRVIEWPEHPFFLGTLYVPQARSQTETPHPVVTAFLNAA